MNISQITAACVGAYPSRQPLMIWGPPGVGKSMGVREAANVLATQYPPRKIEAKTRPITIQVDHFGFIDLRLSIREPSDLLGVMWPDVAKGIVRNFPSSFLPTSGRGILFLDELVQATQLMQAAASQLILDRRVGEYVLPEGWHIIAAGNRMGDRAATNAMPKHIANRFLHLYAEVDVDSWIAWALTHGVDMRVIAFIKFRRALLHAFDPQLKGEAFPTPRSWEFVSTLIKTFKGDRSILAAMIRGSVGEGAGGEFDGFLRVFDKLVSIDTIRLNPMRAPIPDDMGALFAVTNSLAHSTTRDNIASTVTYFNRISDKGHPDFSIAAMKELTLRDESLAKTREFIEWASKHNHILS